MKAKELMIGDWFIIPAIADHRQDYTTRVEGIGKDVVLFNRKSGYDNINYNRIKPVPLTAEIFELNGWKYSEWDGNSWYTLETKDGMYLEYHCQTRRIQIRETISESYINLFLRNITCVHELQNIMRMCERTSHLADDFKVQ